MALWTEAVARKMAPKVANLGWQEKLFIQYCKTLCQAAGTAALPKALISKLADGLASSAHYYHDP